MTQLLSCKICGFECKGLTLHLKFKHSITPKEYRVQFPDAEIFSTSVRKQMSNSNTLKNNPHTSYEERFGKQRADEIKAKISAKTSARLKGTKRTEDYKQKMRETWQKNRDEWTKSIQVTAQKPENRQKQREQMKERIAKNGYHLAWGKETKLEKGIRGILESLNYTVVKQYKTDYQVNGAIRFFDLFVPNLNLLVECDGEYWHCTEDRINIDLAKTKYAEDMGFSILRVVDKEFKRDIFKHFEESKAIIVEKLKMSKEEMVEHSYSVINHRQMTLYEKQLASSK